MDWQIGMQVEIKKGKIKNQKISKISLIVPSTICTTFWGLFQYTLVTTEIIEAMEGLFWF